MTLFISKVNLSLAWMELSTSNHYFVVKRSHEPFGEHIKSFDGSIFTSSEHPLGVSLEANINNVSFEPRPRIGSIWLLTSTLNVEEENIGVSGNPQVFPV